MDEPSPREARPAPIADSTRSTDRLALASVVVGGLLVAVFLASRIDLPGGGSGANVGAFQAGTTTTVTRPGVGAQPVAVSAATAAPTPLRRPTPTPSGAAGEHFRIANTDGEGVVLRATPNDDDWTPRGYMDGDAVTVLERSGSDWARVRGDNGQEGWVPTRYLAP